MSGPELMRRIDVTLAPLRAAVEMFKAGRMDELTLNVMNEHTERELRAIGDEARESLRPDRDTTH